MLPSRPETAPGGPTGWTVALVVLCALACGGGTTEVEAPAPVQRFEAPPEVEPEPVVRCTDPTRAIRKAGRIDVRVRRKPYLVSGTTPSAVRADIEAKKEGDWDATAQYYVTWELGKNCKRPQPKVTLDLEYTHPKWDGNGPKELKERWQAYMRALKCHEFGHAEIGVAAAEATVSRIEALRPSSCREARKLADETFQALIVEHNAMQAAYDAETDHGATQGARFP